MICQVFGFVGGDPSFVLIKRSSTLTFHSENISLVLFTRVTIKIRHFFSTIKLMMHFSKRWECHSVEAASHLKTMMKVKIQFSYLISARKYVFFTVLTSLNGADLFFSRKLMSQQHTSIATTIKREKDCERFLSLSHFSCSLSSYPLKGWKVLLLADIQSILIRQLCR